MKNALFTLLLLIYFFPSSGQYDERAKSALDAMSSKYKKIESFKANFSQRLTNQSADLNETIAGKIAVKDDKYVLEIAGQRIFNNGSEIYSYNPEISEVTISTYDPEEEEITLSNVYDLYKDGFKYALVSTGSDGSKLIELAPENRDKSYFKIQMVINTKDELNSFTVYENTGNKYIYTIETFSPSPLPDSYFTFDTSKYPNAEVIDFR
ncbi:MAG: outer membrane lipoprotein carrier protein LolA [Bacteroidota bacterium]